MVPRSDVKICDFCNSSDAQWQLVMSEPLTATGVSGSGETESVRIPGKDWSVCQKCKDLVVAGNWDGVFQRVWNAFRRARPIPLTEQQYVRESLRGLYTVLEQLWTGEAKQLAEEPSLADQKAVAARAFSEPVEFMRTAGLDDYYMRGSAIFVIPGLREGMHPDYLRALKMRRQASLKGECPGCGAAVDIQSGDMYVRHDDNCPAGDENLQDLVRRLGKPPTNGRRLEDHEVENIPPE